MRKIIKMTEQQYNHLVESIMGEGIDFAYDTREVSYNPSHENNVDTSIEHNPSVDETIVNGIRVWSIFQRKRGLRGDGNPLIYALKGENGWHFRSDGDYQMVMQQFDKIATKFAQLYNVGVTILVPSGSELNNHIASVITSKSKNAKIIYGVICKITTEEIADIALDHESEFFKYYNAKGNFNAAYIQLGRYLDDMDTQRHGTFSRHMVKDPEMRNVLNYTLKVSSNKYAEYANDINDQNILIIDDTISRGQTIQEVCRIMMESYNPKSITVLTLLSRLKD